MIESDTGAARFKPRASTRQTRLQGIRAKGKVADEQILPLQRELETH